MNKIDQLEKELDDNWKEITKLEGKVDFDDLRVLYLRRSLIKDNLLKEYRSEYVSRSNNIATE